MTTTLNVLPAPAAEQERSGLNRLFGVTGPVLALFYFAGIFKTQIGLPIDLTLLLALILAVMIVARLIQSAVVPTAVFWAVALWAAMLLSINSADPNYGMDKAVAFSTLTFLGAVAPALLLRDAGAVRRFAASLVAVGLVVTASAAAGLGSLGALDRLSAFDANTISLGRAAGAGLTALTAMWLLYRAPFWLALPAMGAMAAVMLASGSRGPLAAVIFAALPLLLAGLRDSRGLGRVALLVGAVISAGAVALPFLPQQSLARINTLLGGELDRSAGIRAEALQYSWPVIQASPLGIGLGNFQYAVALSPTPEPLRYPHNLLTEVALEAGWLPALLLIGLVLAAVGRCVAEARQGRPTALLLLSLLLFAFVNALVSGDLNDNRLFWGLLFLSLSISSIRPSPVPRASG